MQQVYQCFRIDISNKIAHLVLNRPEKRNSMNPAFWEELPLVVAEIDNRSLARVIVISSTGPHFSSGLDLDIFSRETDMAEKHQRLQQAESFYLRLKSMQEAFSILETCRIPVLAAIQGGCIGGGVDLVSACDMRYATDNAFFTIYEINVGLTADLGTFPRITRLMPEGIVRELAYTGRSMLAKEALARGLVNAIYASQEAMLGGVMEIARQIAAKAPSAISGTKQILNYSRDHSTADTLDHIAIWNASRLQQEEINEALAAAAAGREGEFVDLTPRQGR